MRRKREAPAPRLVDLDDFPPDERDALRELMRSWKYLDLAGQAFVMGAVNALATVSTKERTNQ